MVRRSSPPRGAIYAKLHIIMHTIVFADGSFASSPCTHPEKRSDGSDYNISNARWSVLERCSFWAKYIRRAPAADCGRQERHYVLLRLVITGRVLFRSRDHRPCRMAVFPLPAWSPHAGGVADRAWHHRSHETVRQWVRKFGQQFANQIRRHDLVARAEGPAEPLDADFTRQVQRLLQFDEWMVESIR